MAESIKRFVKNYKIPLQLVFLYFSVTYVYRSFGWDQGLFPNAFEASAWLKIFLYVVIMTHLTITTMSLSMHRHHTHKSVVIHPVLDHFFQIWLWLITSIGKRDWVSVHAYHHATSDTPEDPHSPVYKGFWHVLFLGAFDYNSAKDHPEVLKIRAKIPETKIERYMGLHHWDGPAIMTAINITCFGIFWGTIISVINYLIAPLFAIGGVNTLAHWWGYRNHKTTDNSRNVGFILPLNFLVCGEMDHNNHHARQFSCSFRHRWYEFDIGYFYIKNLEKLGLLTIKHAYTPRSYRGEITKAVMSFIERDSRIQERLNHLANELNLSVQQLKLEVQAYFEKKRTEINSARFKEFVRELKSAVRGQASATA